MIRVLIADDEPLARAGLRDLIALEADLEVVGEARDGPDAVAAIHRMQPDLVFLDVEMPGYSGVDVLARLEVPIPAVVFVTAYDAYAIQAFEVNAVDYLLKPVESARFHRAVARARAQLAVTEPALERLTSALDALDRGPGPSSRFVVKSAGRIRFVRVEDVVYIEAAGNYVRLHTRDARHSIRETMQGLEQRLDPTRFLRIHRSFFVNLDEVREIQHWVKDELIVLLKGGGKLPLSRAYRVHLEERLRGQR
jgi:two-component system LytT family response regulator